MMPRMIAIVLLSFSLWAIGPATPVSPARAQDAGTGTELMPLKQVELDRSLAIRALDTYIALSKTVGIDQLETLFENSTEESLTSLVPQLTDILVTNGFTNEDRWIEALQSVVIAYEALQGNNLAESKRALEEIQNDNDLPPDQKRELITMLNSMIPSENNLQVLRDLMRDPETNQKLAQVLEEM
ncbi:hypothetical protein [Rhodoligotrophos defluvii]|uniref:hypothetical protein n=1 Tax=Rhodoligotrophos defluvii TaxID=2561934 RepID=UPI0010C97B0B|nr:hypothetical protein [Rhodoligotrophos defluvii]